MARRFREMSMREAITKAVKGQRTPHTATSYRQAKDLIKTFGERDAAERLGVAIRTLRSWANPNRLLRRNPSKANRSKLGSLHDTRDVRAATAPRRRMQKMSRKGMKVNFVGMAGPLNDSPGASIRPRKLQFDLPPHLAQQIMDAYIEGGPDAAHQAFREAVSSDGGYHAGVDWHFSDPSQFRFDASDSFSADDDW